MEHTTDPNKNAKGDQNEARDSSMTQTDDSQTASSKAYEEGSEEEEKEEGN